MISTENYNERGIICFRRGDFPRAVEAFTEVYKRDEDFPFLHQNLGLSLIRIGRFEEAINHLKIAEKKNPADLNLLQGLADVMLKVGNREISRHYGEKALLLLDKMACANSQKFCITGRPPTFSANHPDQNVISFSLFGNHPRYLTGAVKNILAAKEYYPGWHCRFYCDDMVPRKTLKKIVQLGAKIIMMKAQRWSDGLFWRFLVAEDPSVKYFLIRDVDSVVNKREQYAVHEWLGSGSCFHIMRDYSSHTDLILAGLWGGAAGILPPLATLLKGFVYDPLTESRNADQLFLGRVVWPIIKNNCMIHDSHFRVFNAFDFPPGSELPPGHHVGENDYALN